MPLQGYQGAQPQLAQSPQRIATHSPTAVYDRIKEFTDNRNKELDELTVDEATKQAYSDAAAGKPFDERVSNLYGKVYNNVRTATYSAKAEIAMAEQSERLADQFKDDPEGYDNAFKSFYESLVEKSPTAELRATISLSGQKRRTATYGKLKEIEQIKLNADAVETFTRSLDLNATQIAQLEADGDYERASLEKVKNLDYINAMVNSGLLSPQEATKLKTDYAYKITYTADTNRVEDLINKGQLSQADNLVQSLTEKPREDMGIMEWERYKDDLNLMITRAYKAEQAKASGLKEEANLVLGKVNELLAKGKTPPVELMNQARDLASYASLTKQDELNTQLEAFNVIKYFSDRSLPEQEEFLAQFKASPGATQVSQEVLSQVEENLKKRKAMAKKDPMLLGAEEGRYTITPLSMNMKPEDLSEELQNRMSAQLKNKLEYGEYASNLLTESEAEEWGSYLESPTTSIAEKLNVINALNETVQDKAPTVFRQLSKSGAPVFSFSAQLIEQGKVETAKKVLRGQTILKELKGIVDFEALNWKLYGQIDNALQFADTGEREALFKSASSYYAAISEENGTLEKGLSGSTIKKAIKELTGGVAKRNGRSFFLPQGVDEDDFDDFIDSFSASSPILRRVALLKPDQAADAIKRGEIIYVSPGKYAVKYKNGVLKDKTTGKTFILEYK